MWFIVDSCGIGCCIATYCIMAFVSTLVIKTSILPLGREDFINPGLCIGIYLVFLTLAGLSHARCMITDPGAIPKNSVQISLEEKEKVPAQVCLKCKCNKSSRTHHCSICTRCISKMDHHCPWINNCVGFYTQKHFVLFLFYIMISCLYSFIMLIIRATFCATKQEAQLCKRPREEVSLDLLLGLAAFFVGGIFFLFVTVMLYDQISCIITNASGIDLLKKSPVEKRSAMINLEETFGGKFGIYWFIPTRVKGSLTKCAEMNEN